MYRFSMLSGCLAKNVSQNDCSDLTYGVLGGQNHLHDKAHALRVCCSILSPRPSTQNKLKKNFWQEQGEARKEREAQGKASQ